MTDIGGWLTIEPREDGVNVARVVHSEVFSEQYEIPFGWDVLVENDDMVKEKQVMAEEVDGDGQLAAKSAGEVFIDGHVLYIRYERTVEEEYELPASARLRDEIAAALRESKNDAIEVEPGTQLTEGSKNPHQILRVLGEEPAQHYLLKEVQQVYRNQGVNISDKHFEVIIRKMLSKVTVTRSGDSGLLPGELIDKLKLLDMNERLIAQGMEPAAGVPVLLGVTKAALSTDSFLSASSFQHTIKVLAGAAIEGKEDRLYGLKENVIIGKLIASGTGFHTYQDREIAVADLTLESQGALASDDSEIDEEDEYDEYEELEEALTAAAPLVSTDDDDDGDDDDDDDDNVDGDDGDDAADDADEEGGEYLDMSLVEDESGLD